LAAALSALLVAVILVRPADKPGPELVEVPLEKRAEDLVTPAFTGTDAYAGMSGRVVWSDKFQEGYMELTNLAVNDPSRNQYQLWIVDPGRAKQPVDGGVFDIDSSGTVRVPIDAKLAVRKPQAFVITLEKPGGVVVSEQETVVAISKVGV
jgi:anti-sigma-K factor RskA